MKQIRRTGKRPGATACSARCDDARESILSGDLEEALWHLRQAVEVDRDSVTAWQLLGHCFEQIGEPERARRCYKLAFRLSVAAVSGASRRTTEPLPIVWPSRHRSDT